MGERASMGCVGTVGARLNALGHNSMWRQEKRRVRHERREISTILLWRPMVGRWKDGHPSRRAPTLATTATRAHEFHREAVVVYPRRPDDPDDDPDDDRGIVRSDVGWPRERCLGVSDTSGG